MGAGSLGLFPGPRVEGTQNLQAENWVGKVWRAHSGGGCMFEQTQDCRCLVCVQESMAAQPGGRK